MAQILPERRVSRASPPASVTSKLSESTVSQAAVAGDLYIDKDLLENLSNIDLKGDVSLKAVGNSLVAGLKNKSTKVKNYNSAAEAFAEGTRYCRESRGRQASTFKMPVKMEPTYRTEPRENQQFSVSKTEQLVRELMEQYLGNKSYDASQFSSITCSLVTAIKNAMKQLSFPRYKVVCQVTLSENKSQGFRAVSRAVWDTMTDSMAVVTYNNQHIHAVATVFGVYLDWANLGYNSNIILVGSVHNIVGSIPGYS